jgi:hypothetical protein
VVWTEYQKQIEQQKKSEQQKQTEQELIGHVN